VSVLPRTPTTIGPYGILGEIARGGMGVVYRARDQRTGAEVAIKVLLAHGASEERHRKRFVRELRAMIKLRHPYVVPVLDAGEQDESPFLVMALVEGESLAERIEREVLEPDHALALTRKLAQALAHCHVHSVLHRDVKPANVLLSPAGDPLLTDFGVAKHTDASQTAMTLAGKGLGTPGYWPPEQAKGQLQAMGPASDLYALGGTLYAMLTGSAPHEGSSPHMVAIGEATIHPPSASRPGLDPALDAIVLRCLQPDPQRRYPSAEALVADLDLVLSGRPLADQADRRRPPMAAALALAAVGGLATLWAMTPEQPPRPPAPPNADERSEAVDRALGAMLAAETERDSAIRERDTDRVRRRAAEADAEGLRRELALARAPLEPGGLPPTYVEDHQAPTPEAEAEFAGLMREASQALAEDRYEDADRAFAEALRLNPLEAEAYVGRGEVNKALGRFQDAYLHYATGLHLDPANATGWYDMGNLFFRVGQHAAAIDCYDHAQGLDPADLRIYVNRGNAYAQLGDMEAARRDWEHAVREDPQGSIGDKARGNLERLR
jgi:tetratricopeptide (TPR) repeat protein